MQDSREKDNPSQFMRTPVAAGVVLALASPTLLAQESRIEEIVTTAQKREQSLQDVPISIQALGACIPSRVAGMAESPCSGLTNHWSGIANAL